MILFLDFDGVLHPDPCPPDRLFEHATVLARTLAPFRLQVVLSTSWRSVHPLADLKARLPAALAARVVGTTPNFSAISAGAGPLHPYPRQAECMAWLQQHAPGRAWHALDDRAEWFAPYCEHLTVCDARTGVTAQTLAHLVSAVARATRGTRPRHPSE
jgi:hypothetical protein